MTKRYIQSFVCCFPDPENEREQVDLLIPDIPKRAARRMSTLGKQMHHVLSRVQLDLDTSLVYGTTYTEAIALETYLNSIPFASPTAFQTSIHPGGIEQALIMNKQEVGALFPVAGDQRLFLQMLQVGFSCVSPRVVLAGGEEKGSWLTGFDLAYSRSFAFSLCISTDPTDAIGEICWTRDFQQDSPVAPGMETAVDSMRQASPMVLGSRDHGQYEISWK